jgi:hypothetical protein
MLPTLTLLMRFPNVPSIRTSMRALKFFPTSAKHLSE